MEIAIFWTVWHILETWCFEHSCDRVSACPSVRFSTTKDVFTRAILRSSGKTARVNGEIKLNHNITSAALQLCSTPTLWRMSRGLSSMGQYHLYNYDRQRGMRVFGIISTKPMWFKIIGRRLMGFKWCTEEVWKLLFLLLNRRSARRIIQTVYLYYYLHYAYGLRLCPCFNEQTKTVSKKNPVFFWYVYTVIIDGRRNYRKTITA